MLNKTSVPDVLKVSEEELLKVIDFREPIGLFYYENLDGTSTGVDNSTSNAWTENFSNLALCILWLLQDLDDEVM